MPLVRSAALFDQVGPQLLARMGWEEQFAWAQARIDTYGFVALVVLGAIPVPTQIGMIAAGALGFPLWLFVPAVSLPRGVRYFGLALAVRCWGDRVERWLRRRTRQPDPRGRAAGKPTAQPPR